MRKMKKQIKQLARLVSEIAGIIEAQRDFDFQNHFVFCKREHKTNRNGELICFTVYYHQYEKVAKLTIKENCTSLGGRYFVEEASIQPNCESAGEWLRNRIYYHIKKSEGEEINDE